MRAYWRCLPLVAAATLALVAIHPSCGSAGFNPELASAQMTALEKNATSYVAFAEATGHEQAAETAAAVAKQVAAAHAAFDAYIAGTGGEESLWAALEGVAVLTDAIIKSDAEDDLKQAAFLVGAAARTLQAWFPEDPPE